MRDFLNNAWVMLLSAGGWITTVMLAGLVLKLNYYIFMWGWGLI